MVEPFYIAHLKNSNPLNSCTVSNVSSLRDTNDWREMGHISESTYKLSLLNAANSILTGYKNDFAVSDLSPNNSQLKTQKVSTVHYYHLVRNS